MACYQFTPRRTLTVALLVQQIMLFLSICINSIDATSDASTGVVPHMNACMRASLPRDVRHIYIELTDTVMP